MALLAVAFIAVVLAWFGWWDEIAKLIPYLSVHMNTGFYVVFSTGLFIIWALMFFVFDRLTYWRIRPAQMTEEHLIGGGAESFDTNGLRFQKVSSDFFRSTLGFGASDLRATVGGRPRGIHRNIECHLRLPQSSSYRKVDFCKGGKHFRKRFLKRQRAVSPISPSRISRRVNARYTDIRAFCTSVIRTTSRGEYGATAPAKLSFVLAFLEARRPYSSQRMRGRQSFR